MYKVITQVTDVLQIILELLKTLKNKFTKPKKRLKKKILGAEVVLKKFFSRSIAGTDFSRSCVKGGF